MSGFSKLDDSEIVSFLVEHIKEFTDEPSSDFPRYIKLGLANGHLKILRKEHAVAVVAQNCGVAYRPQHAELILLYTDSAARGQGEAGILVEQIKQDPVIGVPIRL